MGIYCSKQFSCGEDLDNALLASVKVTEQTLTEEQKAQARANIGAVTVEDVLAALPTWTGGSY